MKTVSIFLLLTIFLIMGCKKHHPTETTAGYTYEKMNYHLYDATIIVYDNMNGGAILQEDHSLMDSDINLDKIIETGQLLYNKDTFVLQQNGSDPYYSPIAGSFPLLKFNSDSIVIYRHLYGVGTQTWQYLHGIKK